MRESERSFHKPGLNEGKWKSKSTQNIINPLDSTTKSFGISLLLVHSHTLTHSVFGSVAVHPSKNEKRSSLELF